MPNDVMYNIGHHHNMANMLCTWPNESSGLDHFEGSFLKTILVSLYVNSTTSNKSGKNRVRVVVGGYLQGKTELK